MNIPPSLVAADQRLHAYGRWAMMRPKYQHCGSAEGRYRPPAWESAPHEDLVPDWSALETQRALVRVPFAYRRVLLAVYVPQRLPVLAQRRLMRISASTWDDSHLAGLRMFANVTLRQGANRA